MDSRIQDRSRLDCLFLIHFSVISQTILSRFDEKSVLSTVEYSTVQYSTVQYSTVECNRSESFFHEETSYSTNYSNSKHHRRWNNSIVGLWLIFSSSFFFSFFFFCDMDIFRRPQECSIFFRCSMISFSCLSFSASFTFHCHRILIPLAFADVIIVFVFKIIVVFIFIITFSILIFNKSCLWPSPEFRGQRIRITSTICHTDASCATVLFFSLFEA